MQLFVISIDSSASQVGVLMCVAPSCAARIFTWSTTMRFASGESNFIGQPDSAMTTPRQMGSTVVCLVSDSTMLEFTSWMPGSWESFSKKNCSYALMSSVTIRSRKSTLPSTT